MRILLLLLVCLCSPLAECANDAFPLSRRGGLSGNIWTNTGIPGGWPARTTIFAQYSNAVTLSALNTGLANCPSNQVVQLEAGKFDLGGTIVIATDGVTLRGTTNSSGYPTTIITNADIKIGSGSWPSANWNNATPIGVSSGYTEGSTSITLASSANADFAVGDCFMLDQTDDGTLVKTSSLTFAHRPSRSYSQTLRCISKSGSVIGFEPPLLGTYWSAGQTPQAFGWSSYVGRTFNLSGVEDIKHDEPGAVSYSIQLGRCHGCWAKNIVATQWGNAGGATACLMVYSTHCAVFDGIFHDHSAVANSSYALYGWQITACKVENNIITNCPLACPMINWIGCSFSYNLRLGPFPYSDAAWLPEDFFSHGGHTHHTIWEGNWSDGVWYMDAIFGGNNSDLAIVRSRQIGWFSGKTGNTVPIQLEQDMDNMTIIGNTLGQEGYHTSYETTAHLKIYAIDGTDTGTIRTNNYNTVDDGIRSTEVMSADTMRDSYVYESKPSWWGDRQWPPFPAAALTTNTLYYTNFPAGYRSKYGQWPPAAAGGGADPGQLKITSRVKLKR